MIFVQLYILMGIITCILMIRYLSLHGLAEYESLPPIVEGPLMLLTAVASGVVWPFTLGSYLRFRYDTRSNDDS